ncbi:hypothetical protein EJ110_NYTH11219 [Nymphaea thermarum]|nr:hypothetical protein EJ110_NYTH11219 [Nymphaea thermarum]
MALPEGSDMVLERPLVLEIRAADTVPELPTVFLMGPPVTLHRKGLGALPAPVGLVPMLPLVVRLECPEVLKRPCPRVIYVVLAALNAAVARQPQHGRRLCPSQRFRPFPVHGSMPPHVTSASQNSADISFRLPAEEPDLRAPNPSRSINLIFHWV